MSERDFRSSLTELPPMDPNVFGEQPVTNEMRDVIRWAETEFAKMRSGKK